MNERNEFKLKIASLFPDPNHYSRIDGAYFLSDCKFVNKVSCRVLYVPFMLFVLRVRSRHVRSASKINYIQDHNYFE